MTKQSASDKTPLKELGHITSLEAAKILEENSEAKLIDIRTSMEYLFIGHPTQSTHVAWMDDPDWEFNPNFYKEVHQMQKSSTNNNCPIMLICRSGNRSEKAGLELIEKGMTNVYHITDGFEGERDENNHRGTLDGWRFNGLPWEQA